MTTQDKVLTLLQRILELDEPPKLTEDLGADSLDAIEIMMALEEEFNIEFSEHYTEETHTPQDIVDIINRYTSGGN